MTVPCTSCGEILDPGELRCPYCGTLAPPVPGTSVFAHEEAAPRWADEPTRVEPAAVRPTTDDPLTIPIREPSPDVPRARGEAAAPRPALVGAAVVAVVVLGLLAGQVLGGGGDDVASDGDPPTTDAAVAGVSTDATDPSTTSSVPSTTITSTTTTASTTSTTTATTAPTTAPTTTTVADPGSVPLLADSFRSGWVAQLSSVPTSAGTAALESAWNRVRADAADAVATRSDEWPSMSPGYWVLVEPGPFASEDAVDAFCASVGRSGDDCLPRMLSDRR